MGKDEFLKIYSPLFSELWKFFKRWGMSPPRGKEWERFSGEVSEVQKLCKAGGRLSVDMTLAVIREVEYLAGCQDGKERRNSKEVGDGKS